MKHIQTTLQPPHLLNRKDLDRMKEGRHITTDDFDSYWDHTECSVVYTDAHDEPHTIGELYRDHNDALWTFNGKGLGGENLATGTTPRATILAALNIWENDLVLSGIKNKNQAARPASEQLHHIQALHRRWEAQNHLDDKDRDMQDHEYLADIGEILRLAQ